MQRNTLRLYHKCSCLIIFTPISHLSHTLQMKHTRRHDTINSCLTGNTIACDWNCEPFIYIVMLVVPKKHPFEVYLSISFLSSHLSLSLFKCCHITLSIPWQPFVNKRLYNCSVFNSFASLMHPSGTFNVCRFT